MNLWMATAMELAQKRVPLMTDDHAHDLADDLYRAWPDDTPQEAVAKFFSFMPSDWIPRYSAVSQRVRATA